MPNKPMTRRRCLTILAAAGAVPLFGAARGKAAHLEWQGVALGADARLIFADRDRERAASALAAALREIERLERIFSLYRPDSELCRLNAGGALTAPSHDMSILLGLCRRFHEATAGAFDPTVQPLWRLLARHFATRPQDPPAARLIDEALHLVGFDRVTASAEGVRLGPGMALTLNGIAQGYITDRIADLLRDAGFAHVLVQLGETRALPGGTWRVGIPGIEGTIALKGGAIATSAGAATPLSRDGSWTHLLDPRRGIAPRTFRSVSVLAPTASEADALSTALAVLPFEAFEATARRFPAVRVLAVTAEGRVHRAGHG